MPAKRTRKVALLWQGDRKMRTELSVEKSRMSHIADALSAVGIDVEAAVYADEFAGEVRDQLIQLDGVLVWVNPVNQGHDRSMLNEMLLQVANKGVFVSAHPELIQTMGAKDVLYKTRDMSWGSDTHLYENLQQFQDEFPGRLAEGKPRVLKLNQGSGGNGVWKVELAANRSSTAGTGGDFAPKPDSPVLFRHAGRGSVEETLTFENVLSRIGQNFLNQDQIIDQPYQERLPEGMVRCYLVGDKVAGFGKQLINALYPTSADAPGEEPPEPGPRVYYPPTKPEFQALRERMETEWLPAMQQLLHIETESLPIIWDADFLYGPKDAEGQDSWVLCEINISAVYPFPDEALAPLAQETLKRIV